MLNKIFAYTELQTTFGANLIAIVNGKPQVLTLKEMLQNGEITQAEYNAEIKSRSSSEESNNSEENSSSDNVAKTEGEAE